MKNILIDTSVIIDFLRRKDKEQTLLYGLTEETLYISIISHAELYAGKSIWEKSDVKKALEKTLSKIPILNIETGISIKAGHIKAYHHNNSLVDCIIAATAITNNLELATLNVKDFKPIKELMLVQM